VSPYYQAPQAHAAPPSYQQQTSYVPDQTDQVLASLGIHSGGPRNPWATPPPSPVDTSRIPRGAITPENFLNLAGLWRGGEGQREAIPCPKCNGILFRRFENGKEARPLCTDCGYNGSFSPGDRAERVA